jgi:hypothetical protein
VSGMPAVDATVTLTLRAALAVLFCSAAAHKLRDLPRFRSALAAYRLVPSRCLRVFATVLIAAEIGVGGGLLAPGVGHRAALAAAGMLLVYSAAIGINLLRGRRLIDCGCLGAAARRPLNWGLLARNAVLMAAALIGALPGAVRGPTWIDAVTVGAGVATLALLYGAVDGLMANAPWIGALVRDPGSRLRAAEDRQVGHA